MKSSSSLLIFASIVLVLVLTLAFTDAAVLINEESMIENSSSDENESSLRNKKDIGVAATQHLISSPNRRHQLKFGVLGKRYNYGYLGKRDEVSQNNNDFEEWLDYIRERRARPQYGMLG